MTRMWPKNWSKISNWCKVVAIKDFVGMVFVATSAGDWCVTISRVCDLICPICGFIMTGAWAIKVVRGNATGLSKKLRASVWVNVEALALTPLPVNV